jgi:hypothetical protein
VGSSKYAYFSAVADFGPQIWPLKAVDKSSKKGFPEKLIGAQVVHCAYFLFRLALHILILAMLSNKQI